MSVKIEVLDYVYGVGGNLVDFSAGTAATGWSLSTINNQRANWSGDGSSNTKFYEDITETLQAGSKYRIKIVITNYSGDGTSNIGISASITGNIANGIGQTFRASGNTTIEDDVTITTTGKLRVFGRGTNSGTISVSVTRLDGIVWEDSIVGRLDVSDHTDFPLALTFQISDIKNITSTSGNFSKTFKIPATKNNNKILKHQFNPNSLYNGEHISSSRKCRISVDDFFSLTGRLKVTGIEGYGETPNSYDCVFYGNNLSWAKDLEGKYLNESFSDGYSLWGSAGSQLEYNKAKITTTWADENCDSSTSPIVYPVVSYGNYNANGDPNTIQLLDTAYDYNETGSPNKKGYSGFFDSGSSYNTPSPSADWRPAVWVKTTIVAIFQKLGYSISSTFMDSDMFKQLVWLLPNFKYNNVQERENEFSLEYKLVTERTKTLPSSGGAIPAQDVNLFTIFEGGGIKQSDEDSPTTSKYDGDNRQFVGLANASSPFPSGYNIEIIKDNNSRLDFTPNDEITIGEYGYYNINVPSFEVQVSQCYKDGTIRKEVFLIGTCINLELHTVGQKDENMGHWNIIGRIEKELHPHVAGTSSHEVNVNNSSSTPFESTDSISLESYWLNKGDRLKLSRGIKIISSSDASQAFDVFVSWRNIGESKFTISLDANRVEYGQTYDLKNVINNEYKQVDFIKGVAHAFNLILTTNEVTKTIEIEPFNDFYLPYADAIDWTSKLDRSRQIKDSWVKSDLKRSVVFKYKSDSKDEKVKTRGQNDFNKIDDEFPYFTELSDSFERGSSVYENPFFAGTFNAVDNDGQAFPDTPAYSACLWETDSDPKLDRAETPKGFDFEPRLLHYRKYSPSGTVYNNGFDKRVTVQTWVDRFSGVIPNSNLTVDPVYSIVSNSFPQATSINRDHLDSPVLSYGNVLITDYNDSTGVYAASVAKKGLFETYYEKMFTMIKASPRVRTAYIYLKLADIINLNFRRLIYIDGAYWRINKILDYKPNTNQPTKVELLYWLETENFSATQPSFGG